MSGNILALSQNYNFLRFKLDGNVLRLFCFNDFNCRKIEKKSKAPQKKTQPKILNTIFPV
jgi:hypothetical protein